MTTDARQRWLEALRVLASNPKAAVRCPEQNDAVLEVHDVVIEASPTMIERYLVCPACGARNIIMMRRPAEEGSQ
jgi:DNA-directed RNA polymerase subunit RPC12/RpoP